MPTSLNTQFQRLRNEERQLGRDLQRLMRSHNPADHLLIASRINKTEKQLKKIQASLAI